MSAPKLPWSPTKAAGVLLTGVGLATVALALAGMPIGRFSRHAIVEWGDVAPTAPARPFIVLFGFITATPGLVLLWLDWRRSRSRHG